MSVIYKKGYPIKIFLSLLAALLLLNPVLAQREIPPRPSFQTSVYDGANMLSSSEKNSLEQKLINHADTTSTQIVVVTINSLEGEYIGTFAAEWANKWGIGQSGKDNGVLLLASKNDRKFWITTGYGLEAFLTDSKTSQIYRNVIRPAFKKGNYYQGLDEGTTAIMLVLAGEFENSPYAEKDDFPFSALIPLFFFIVFMVILFRGKNNGRGGGSGSHRDGSWLFDAILLSSLGRNRGGFGGGSFGGGGFGGGFGGGGFGGGGAGGSW